MASPAVLPDTTLEDAPFDSAAWAKCKFKESHNIAQFRYASPDGGLACFQATLRGAGGSRSEALRIARLCYMRLEAGQCREQVLAYRDELYKQCTQLGTQPAQPREPAAAAAHGSQPTLNLDQARGFLRFLRIHWDDHARAAQQPGLPRFGLGEAARWAWLALSEQERERWQATAVEALAQSDREGTGRPRDTRGFGRSSAIAAPGTRASVAGRKRKRKLPQPKVPISRLHRLVLVSLPKKPPPSSPRPGRGQGPPAPELPQPPQRPLRKKGHSQGPLGRTQPQLPQKQGRGRGGRPPLQFRAELQSLSAAQLMTRAKYFGAGDAALKGCVEKADLLNLAVRLQTNAHRRDLKRKRKLKKGRLDDADLESLPGENLD